MSEEREQELQAKFVKKELRSIQFSNERQSVAVEEAEKKQLLKDFQKKKLILNAKIQQMKKEGKNLNALQVNDDGYIEEADMIQEETQRIYSNPPQKKSKYNYLGRI